MKIKNWPEDDRPREKLLQKGAYALSDAELLAIVLRTGIKGKPVMDLALEALSQFGGFRKLLNANYEELKKLKGLTLSRYITFQAIKEINTRYLFEKVKKQGILKNSQDTRRLLFSKFRDAQKEIFAAIFLDCQNQVIALENLNFGTVNVTHIYPREFIKKVLKYNASRIILIHNHPSGLVAPSEHDIEMTKKIINALKFIDVEVLDHLIVGENDIFSFAEQGLLFFDKNEDTHHSLL